MIPSSIQYDLRTADTAPTLSPGAGMMMRKTSEPRPTRLIAPLQFLVAILLLGVAALSACASPVATQPVAQPAPTTAIEPPAPAELQPTATALPATIVEATATRKPADTATPTPTETLEPAPTTTELVQTGNWHRGLKRKACNFYQAMRPFSTTKSSIQWAYYLKVHRKVSSSLLKGNKLGMK